MTVTTSPLSAAPTMLGGTIELPRTRAATAARALRLAVDR